MAKNNEIICLESFLKTFWLVTSRKFIYLEIKKIRQICWSWLEMVPLDSFRLSGDRVIWLLKVVPASVCVCVLCALWRSEPN